MPTRTNDDYSVLTGIDPQTNYPLVIPTYVGSTSQEPLTQGDRGSLLDALRRMGITHATEPNVMMNLESPPHESQEEDIPVGMTHFPSMEASKDYENTLYGRAGSKGVRAR